ncbi:hypothetical protein V495_03893 [Pseudogymnoascus sp. VKM F-4514 (FW-929)]|nr:hypothetical protein V490_02439 [Pseudogymnoascus sp. VKM F-3557]KFY43533.1 hypothetical protein V495_03893 [Pseudogymnoascus sp. VKM F-4514 (FW-929)]KFY60383.1 hypothetical protein V497_03672 [Pseudogymnoascus sp. VKM F-4516 (FW-969)]
MYIPSTPWTWAFMVATILQAIVVLGLESYIFARFQMALAPDLPSEPKVKVIPTYLTLFIFAFVYQLVLVYDSLRLKNTIQVIGLCLYNLGILIYSTVQVSQIKDAVWDLYLSSPSYLPEGQLLWPVIHPFLVAVPVIIGLGTAVMSGIAYKLYGEFAWTIYKHISADLRMKRRFLTFQIYIALLKFDFFFFLGFTVQFLVIVSSSQNVEFYLTIAAIPITIVILAMAAIWTRREIKIGMIVNILLYFAALAYFLFKLVRIYQPSRQAQYRPARTSLTIFAVLTIILILLTITNACVCMHNFDKGLKPFVTRRKLIGGDEKTDNFTELPDMKHGGPVAPLPSRMTID